MQNAIEKIGRLYPRHTYIFRSGAGDRKLEFVMVDQFSNYRFHDPETGEEITMTSAKDVYLPQDVTPETGETLPDGFSEKPETYTPAILRPANESSGKLMEIFSEFEQDHSTPETIAMALLMTGLTGETLLSGVSMAIRQYQHFLLDNFEGSEAIKSELRKDIRGVALAVKNESWKLGRIEEKAFQSPEENLADILAECEDLAGKIEDIQGNLTGSEKTDNRYTYDLLQDARERLLKVSEIARKNAGE